MCSPQNRSILVIRRIQIGPNAGIGLLEGKTGSQGRGAASSGRKGDWWHDTMELLS